MFRVREEETGKASFTRDSSASLALMSGRRGRAARYSGAVKKHHLLPVVAVFSAVVPFSQERGGEGVEPSRAEARAEDVAAEFRAIAKALREGSSDFLGGALEAALEAQLTELPSDSPERARVLTRLGRVRIKAGQVEAAIEVLNEALELAPEGDPQRARIERNLAIAWLRKAETENCIVRHNAECCILPLRGGALHEARDATLEARKYYARALEANPGDLAARWVYNVVAMALGEYPKGVPKPWRIRPATFAGSADSEATLGRFRDVAPELGLDRLNLCGGVAVEDFDGDQRLDIVTSTYDPEGPLAVFQSTGAGGFADRSEASGASAQLGGLNLISADYDADGDVDLLVLRGAWLFDDGCVRNSLLRNDGAGNFTDVTRAVGLAEPARPTQTAVWGDFDADGDLDLYVGNESRRAREPQADYPNQLFLQEADGTFVDRAEAAGVENDLYTKGVAAGDYDNDGDLDLYCSNIGPNRLYENRGDGTFRDVASEAGVSFPEGRSFACWFFDYDNDGWLDLFVAAYEGGMAEVAGDYLGLPVPRVPPSLYRNRGDGTFEDRARELGLDHVYLPMGANFGDLDHDGWLDIYLTTGKPELEALMPNVMLRNAGGTRFEDVTFTGGFGHLQKGHGVAFADLDQDGDQDIYHQLGGFYRVDRYPNALFENPGNENHWLYLRLEGRASPRNGCGARVHVRVRTGAGERSIHRAVGSVSSFGGSPWRQEIGLGEARSIARVEIRWPRSDALQVLEDVPLDTSLRVVEGEPGYERLPLEPFSFRRD